MIRRITPKSSLDNLKREAKRWLHALRSGDVEARARLERATPNAPAEPTLRHVQHALAREYGFPGWAALKSRLEQGSLGDTEHAARVAWFIENACPDHHIRGRPAHVRALHTAQRLLQRYPEIARDSFYTAIVCGDVERVEKALAVQPERASEKGGPKGWEPILYLCFTRLDRYAPNENAEAIARMLLDRGADPNVHFAAGGSAYTPLVGAIGEGEEDRPPRAERDALVRLLLERGANPYDIQVIYNTGFHGQMLWYLRLIYGHTVRQGRSADWADPEWMMIGMGGYGSGARWMLNIAVRDNNLELAHWALSHGANPNAGPPRSNLMSQRPLYEGALLSGNTEMAALLLQYGAKPLEAPLDGPDAFSAAALRLDAAEVRRLARRHPEYLASPEPLLTAARLDRDDVVRLLLDVGVSPDVATATGERALHAAAYSNALGVATLLLERGAAVDPINSDYNNTPLGAAVYAQHQWMIELLGRVSRDIWELVYTGNIERLRELFRGQPDLAKVAGGGHTPLMWLPPDDEQRAIDVATLLMSHGADASLKNKEGETAADRARRLGMDRLAELLDGHPEHRSEPR
jgi:ankyrin repeat protein